MRNHQVEPSARWCSCLLLLLVVEIGCGGYGEVSPAAYDYAKALYSITNRQAEDKLDQVGQQIESARKEGDLSDREAGWLNDIISDACEGRWESASRACRTMMEDQVQNAR